MGERQDSEAVALAKSLRVRARMKGVSPELRKKANRRADALMRVARQRERERAAEAK